MSHNVNIFDSMQTRTEMMTRCQHLSSLSVNLLPSPPPTDLLELFGQLRAQHVELRTRLQPLRQRYSGPVSAERKPFKWTRSYFICPLSARARLQSVRFFLTASPWTLERMKHCSDLPLLTIHQFLSRQGEWGPACPISTDKQHGW